MYVCSALSLKVSGHTILFCLMQSAQVIFEVDASVVAILRVITVLVVLLTQETHLVAQQESEL